MFEKETFEVSCPKCGHKSQENVGGLKSHGYTCPECGITLDADQLARALKEAEGGAREIEGGNCQAQEAPGFRYQFKQCFCAGCDLYAGVSHFDSIFLFMESFS